MRRKSLEDANCPLARSLDVIGDWWSLLIVRDALSGLTRFSEFERSLGLAKNILSTRLRDMVRNGVLEIAPASDGSAYREYVLTEKGRKLFPVVVAFGQWGSEFLFAPGEPQSRPLDTLTNQPLRPMRVVSRDGRELAPVDIRSVVS